MRPLGVVEREAFVGGLEWRLRDGPGQVPPLVGRSPGGEGSADAAGTGWNRPCGPGRANVPPVGGLHRSGL